MNDNREFKDAYNRLDRYLQNICNVNGRINLISYYERILPEKKRSNLRTIREFKNQIESHGVSVDGAMPVAPKTFIDFLLNELSYCKKNKDMVANSIKKLLNEKKESLSKKEAKSTTTNAYHDYFQKMYQYKRADDSSRKSAAPSSSHSDLEGNGYSMVIKKKEIKKGVLSSKARIYLEFDFDLWEKLVNITIYVKKKKRIIYKSESFDVYNLKKQTCCLEFNSTEFDGLEIEVESRNVHTETYRQSIFLM